MKAILQKNPFFLFLLPVFFFLHGYVENRGYIHLSDCVRLLAEYLCVAGVLFLIFYRLYREPIRAALFATALLSYNFFFGYLKDILNRHFHFFDRYAIILPLSVIMLIVFGIYLKKTKIRVSRLSFFLNIVLAAWLLLDTSKLFIKTRSGRSTLSLAALPASPPTSNANATPDIYFLLFDEYTSTPALREWYHYDNGPLDSFLTGEGFRVQSGSRSNYPSTIFSLASILNMSYLQGIKDINACTIFDYAGCNMLIYDNEVCRRLSLRNYEIRNYSIFDLPGQPSPVNVWMLPVKANFITHQTFVNKAWRDLGRHFANIPLLSRWLPVNPLYKILADNNTLMSAVKKSTAEITGKPRFVYCHLLIPHSPFFYDRNGRLRGPDEMLALTTHPEKPQSYADYIPYANTVVKELIGTIKKATDGKAVIILMGDHGYRTDDIKDENHLHYFQNLNAVYFPDKDYHLLYDSITGVNQFRVVFDKLFDQHIPLLKDTTIFLVNKK